MPTPIGPRMSLTHRLRSLPTVYIGVRGTDDETGRDSLYITIHAMEPPNNGQVGALTLVHYSEVVLYFFFLYYSQSFLSFT